MARNVIMLTPMTMVWALFTLGIHFVLARHVPLDEANVWGVAVAHACLTRFVYVLWRDAAHGRPWF